MERPLWMFPNSKASEPKIIHSVYNFQSLPKLLNDKNNKACPVQILQNINNAV